MPPLEPPVAIAALDALDAGLLVLGRDERVVAWNGWLAAASGVSDHDAIGRSLSEIFPEAHLARLLSAARDAFSAGSSSLLTHTLHPVLLPLKTRIGRVMIHSIAVRPIGEKPYDHCLVQVTDLTATAERERVLRERQAARYDAVVDSAADPILTFDAQGRVQLANPAAEREFGYAPSELIGQPINRLLAEDSAWTQAFSAVLAGGAVHWPLELVVQRKDGAPCYVDASAAMWTSDARAFVTAIFRDVNERRAAEADLRQLNETLEARVRERTVDLERLHEQLRQSQKMGAGG
jgi:PAS domain S-box-containing protein